MREAESSELVETKPGGLQASRVVAVDRVFKGGALGVLGGGLFTLGANGVFGLGTTGLVLTLGGMVVGGVGCVLVGLAASHLAKFGGRRGALTLAAVGGVGVSTSAWVLSLFLRSEWLALGGSMGFVASVGLVVLLVVGFLIQWARDRGEEKGSDLVDG